MQAVDGKQEIKLKWPYIISLVCIQIWFKVSNFLYGVSDSLYGVKFLTPYMVLSPCHFTSCVASLQAFSGI